jgi:hypothetical protein
MKKYLALVLGAVLGSLISAANSRADDLICYKENGDIEYQAGSPYHIVRATSNGKLVSIYFVRLTKAWGDDQKKEILLASFTNTRCTIKYSERKGIF